ncbi:MAG: hypothetical protein RLZZ116_293 [Planctomycetota bacterium]|jgi:hypothetical protein
MDSSLDFKQAALTRQVLQANTMFQRVLVTWAGDVLELRRRNLLVPRWESTPALTEDQADLPDEPMKHAA